MTISLKKQAGLKAMIIYMIFALLFLTSLKLHIHTGDAVILSDHGAAVSISDFVSIDVQSMTSAGEVEINPDGLFKLIKKTVAFALMLLTVLLALPLVCRFCIHRKLKLVVPRQIQPFFGAPILRAPPLNTYS